MTHTLLTHEITSANKAFLVSEIKNRYRDEGCSICEKNGGEVFWFSPYSRCAHAKCFRIIESAENTLNNSIKELFKHSLHEQNWAHVRASKAVRIACGTDTLLSYHEKNGSQALSNLFKTVGLVAAKQVSSKL